MALLIFFVVSVTTSIAGSSDEVRCAGGITQSRVIAPSSNGGLRRDCGSTTTSRFLQADPMTGGIIEMCGDDAASALPTSQCGETRIGGLVVVRDRLYYTTGTSVRSLELNAKLDDEIVGGFGSFRILGEFFDRVVAVRLRGVSINCSVTSTVLECVATDPRLVGPNSPSLEPNEVVVETELGGNGTFISRTLSELRRAEYKENAPPAVFEIERVENYALRTVAICGDGGGGGDGAEVTLFVSSLGSPIDIVTGTPGGFGGILKLSLGGGQSKIEAFLTEAPRILGLAIYDGRLYYSDAGRGCVVSRDVHTKGNSGDEYETVLANAREPRGLAIDPSGTGLYVSANYRILRISLEGRMEDVVVGPHTAAPDGIVVLPRTHQNSLDRSHRLVWVDANRPKVNAATRYGTRQSDYPKKNEKLLLRFPRALAEREGAYFVGEWLGRIWYLPSINSSHAEILRDDASTKTAENIRGMVEREELARLRLSADDDDAAISARRTYIVPS